MRRPDSTYGVVSYDVHDLEIAPGETLRIGRSAENDLVLPLTLASRFHAEVRWKEGAPHPELVDLGSQNGTRVGGALIGMVDLRGGETFEIAGGELRFRLVFPGSQALLSSDSGMVALFGEGSEQLEGSLESARELGPVVGLIERERRTGTLRVDAGGVTSRITFCMGRVMSARNGDAKSTRALELMVRSPGRCDYRFTPELEPSETGMDLLLSDYLSRWVGAAPLRGPKPKE